MKIWVDADACPVVIKNILFKAAACTGVQLTLVGGVGSPFFSKSCKMKTPHVKFNRYVLQRAQNKLNL